ncbi:MAG TPA: DUF5670 family protein [Anaeromyxobacteraceae bacterium]|nr:DUF5670 family protein [Anaeromyxobacteraceae bacterium]
MLWAVGIMVLLGWMVGVSTVGDRVGPAIHVLLALSLLAFGYAFVRRRRASGVVKPTSRAPPPEARSRA